MVRRSHPEEQGRAAITQYYGRHRVMPTVQAFAKEAGYSSVAGAHHTLDKLVETGLLARDDHGGKLRPGPEFDGRGLACMPLVFRSSF